MIVVVAFLMGALPALAAARVARILGSPARTGKPQPAPREPSPVHDDLATVVGVLPFEGLLVGPHDEVMKMSTQGTMMGLTRGTRVGFPGLLGRVQQARRTSTEYLGNAVQGRSPGMGDIEFSTRVLPLGWGSVLVMTKDEVATRCVDAVRGDFVANIPHELETPIGAMEILAETIEAASEDPQQITHFTRRLQRESARLAELIGQIIELSCLQSSGLMLDRKVVDAKKIIDEAIGRTREAAEVRRTNLVRAAVPCTQVLENRWQLIDTVVNPVRNAIGRSDDNTRVVVAAVQVRGGNGDHVEITVTDNGIGISQEDQECIFECSYRINYGRSQGSGGTGLRLSIIRHIILAHKGSVRVWPRSRRGSTFALRLLAHQDGVVDGETREE